jgi:putative membrane protein
VSARRFLDESARQQAREAIQKVEARTAAEIVIVAHRASGSYRATDFLVGFAGAFAALLLTLFLPQEFPLEIIAVDVLIGFALGAGVSALVPAVRRWLTPRSVQRKNVATHARAAFVEAGVMRTRSRAGILIYASLLERSVEIVPDVAVDPARLGPAWQAAVVRMERALAPPSIHAFLAAVVALAEPLGAALPHQADDENELPDEAVMS